MSPLTATPNATTLRRIYSYFRPYRRRLFFLIFLVMVGVPVGLAPAFLIKVMIDEALPARDGSLLAVLVVAMILSSTIAGLIGVAKGYVALILSQRVVSNLRQQVIQSLLRQSLRFYTKERGGAIAGRLQHDVNAIQTVITNTVVEIAANLFTLVIAIGAMLWLDPWLALLSFSLLPLFLLPAQKAVNKRRELQKQNQEKLAALSVYSQERLSLSGHLLVRLFGTRKTEETRFVKIEEGIHATALRQAVVNRSLAFALELVQSIGPAALIGYGGYRVLQGTLEVGTIFAFAHLLSRLYNPASKLVTVHVNLMASYAVFDRLFQVIDQAPEIKEPLKPVHLPRPRGELRFENVSFSYDGQRIALDGVSFVARPGEKIAIVGHTGAGKTTLSYLVPRLYDPSAGRILLDGHDLSSLSFDSIARAVGYVTQESHFFHTTIAENLRYARPGATAEELERACRAAHIHEVIAKLPEGYETVVGERGYRLSGGEKQRLAIARVLLRDPKILILDEATSALDNESEAKIKLAMESLLQERTSLIIAHRLSTILSADRILVLERGKLVEEGTHEELLACRGIYHRFYTIGSGQSESEDPALAASSAGE
jgi:ATP-binding cassette, subfamily B, bacterial